MPKKNSAVAPSRSELTGYGRDIMKFRVSSGVKGRIRVLSPETKSTGRACRRHPVRGDDYLPLGAFFYRVKM
ncbi:MAG: hypothetical protein DSY90_09170 [Deltaproteobacteria bacterium]|nr:MAG: hypothetical protein DSY90_09170 [Deltaproteobacteria bacterium]